MENMLSVRTVSASLRFKHFSCEKKRFLSWRQAVPAVVILLLNILCASSALAGEWRAEIEGSWVHVGSSPFSDTLQGIGIVTNYGYYDSPNANNVLYSTFELTATLKWIPSPSNPGEVPPQTGTISVREYSDLHLYTSSGATADLDNGFEDEVLTIGAEKRSVGAHLIQVKVNQSGGSYTAKLPKRTMVAWANVDADCELIYSVVIDSRFVAITCPAVDNPYSRYREPALTGPVITNVRQPDGTMRGDTVSLPYDGSAFPVSPITFMPVIGGGWNTIGEWGSKMLWKWISFFNGESFSNSDTLLSYDYPPGFTVSYFDNSQDIVQLSVKDPLDHVQAKGKYYLYFHQKYEPISWPVDNGYPKKVMGTDPEMPEWPVYSWRAVTDPTKGQIPVLVGPQGSSAGITFTASSTTGGSVDGGLGVSMGDVDAHFGGGYNWSNTTEISASVNPTPEIGLGLQTWPVSRPSVQRYKGHLDVYGTNGYAGTGVWRRDIVTGNDYSYYQPYAPSTQVPSDPHPDWAPPGYLP